MTEQTVFDCRSTRVRVAFAAFEVDIDLVEAQLIIDKAAEAAQSEGLQGTEAIERIVTGIQEWLATIEGAGFVERGECLKAYWAITEAFARLKKKFFETHGFIDCSESPETKDSRKRMSLWRMWSRLTKSSSNGSLTPQSTPSD